MKRVGLLLIGLVVFAAAGVGAFAVRSNTDGPGPVDCGSGSLETHCIPGIPGDAVKAILRERGFECSQDRFCELAGANTFYRADVNAHEDVGDLIVQYQLDVRHEATNELSPRAVAFLTWFMVMPFGNDPEAEAVSREWLSENIGGDHEVTIRGFEFVLAAPEPGHVQLRFDGVGDPGPPRTVDGEEPG